MDAQSMEMNIPGTDTVLRPGYKIKLGRFNSELWSVGFGWYSTGGNRPCCGWYLTSDETGIIKALQSTDLMDIYVVQIGYIIETDTYRSIEAIDKEIADARTSVDGQLHNSLKECIDYQIQQLSDRIQALEDAASDNSTI